MLVEKIFHFHRFGCYVTLIVRLRTTTTTLLPSSNHATLQSLVNRLEELQGDEKSSGISNFSLLCPAAHHEESKSLSPPSSRRWKENKKN